ncbi:hypothetical protein [Actinomadura litoris]|uniref:hypothetical protein n=1 Tax=Actinomadura litoris TaxID=2678616 RepID=UPI001FA719CA|nr:hypothetical protein [Actinomadura litoris]
MAGLADDAPPANSARPASTCCAHTASFQGARFKGGTITFALSRFESGVVDFFGAARRRLRGLPDGMADHLS